MGGSCLAIDSRWHALYGKLVKFQETNGHCRVPYQFSADLRLGRWVSLQRASRARNELSDERIALLDQIGFLWRTKSRKVSKFSKARANPSKGIHHGATALHIVTHGPTRGQPFIGDAAATPRIPQHDAETTIVKEKTALQALPAHNVHPMIFNDQVNGESSGTIGMVPLEKYERDLKELKQKYKGKARRYFEQRNFYKSESSSYKEQLAACIGQRDMYAANMLNLAKKLKKERDAK